MKEYIEREAAIKALCFWCAGDVDLDDGEPCSCLGKKEILDAPAADVVEVRHAYWKYNHNGTFVCSDCGGKASKMNWCGHCGAKMDAK